MYAANICKVCLRASEQRCSAVYLSARRRYANRTASAISNNPGFRQSKWYLRSILCFGRTESDGVRLVGHQARYSTDANSLDLPTKDAGGTEETFEEAAGDPPPDELMQSLGEDDRRKLNVLWMELEAFRQTGCPVPRAMSASQWQEAMEKDTRSQRLKFYRYLCVTESRIEKRKRKQAKVEQQLVQARAEREKVMASDPAAYERSYSLSNNTLFLRLYDTTMNALYNTWQCQAIMFGQSIVLDLGYGEHMMKWETINCAKQIRDLYGFNKMNRQAFNLFFCNAKKDNTLLQEVERAIPNLYQESCLITVTEKSYLDVFPKKNLVYLTPHCRNDLDHFDHDAVYIIGGIVDKTFQQPVSLAKAKREGVAMARLPLDSHLDWGLGTKSLTIDQMMKIMLDIKNTGSWTTAFQHVPRRKLRSEDSSDPFWKTHLRKKSRF